VLQKMSPNCKEPTVCFSCCAALEVLDQKSGLRQCPNRCSGAVWIREFGWDPATQEKKHFEELTKSAERKPHPLEPHADYFGVCWRTLYENLMDSSSGYPRVIGYTYADGELKITVDGLALVSTLAAGLHRLRLPKGTASVCGVVCSGPVSGIISYSRATDVERKHQWVMVRVPGNLSSVNWGCIPCNLSGLPVPPPIFSGDPLDCV
jgi:hypothetical protein